MLYNLDYEIKEPFKFSTCLEQQDPLAYNKTASYFIPVPSPHPIKDRKISTEDTGEQTAPLQLKFVPQPHVSHILCRK
jgi:hypothetical protein